MKLTNAQQQAIQTENHYQRTRELLHNLHTATNSSDELLAEQERLNEATNLMLSAHFMQKDRPDGQPYINHPLDVTLHLVNEYKIYQPNMLVTALLHDTVEDQAEKILAYYPQTSTNETEIETLALQVLGQHFGTQVAIWIDKLTNPDFNAQTQSVTNKQEKQQMVATLYREHFATIYEDDPWAFTIKMADFSQNAFHLNTLPESPRKAWFRMKYGPVIVMVEQKLNDLTDPNHPLFSAKDQIIVTLREIYNRDYRP